MRFDADAYLFAEREAAQQQVETGKENAGRVFAQLSRRSVDQSRCGGAQAEIDSHWRASRILAPPTLKRGARFGRVGLIRDAASDLAQFRRLFRRRKVMAPGRPG